MDQIVLKVIRERGPQGHNNLFIWTIEELENSQRRVFDDSDDENFYPDELTEKIEEIRKTLLRLQANGEIAFNGGVYSIINVGAKKNKRSKKRYNKRSKKSKRQPKKTYKKR